MPADSSSSFNLVEEMRQIFSGIYAAANSDQALLAFEVAGIPVDDSMVKLHPTDAVYSPPIAIESLSRLANQAPRVSGGLLSRGLATIDGTIAVCLDAAQPIDAGEMVTLGAVKRDGQDRFTGGQVVSMMVEVPGATFQPAYASPPDWYDGAVAGNWTSYSASQPSSPPSPSPSPATGVAGAPFLVWRILTPAAVEAAPAPPAPPAPPAAPRPLVVRAVEAGVAPPTGSAAATAVATPAGAVGAATPAAAHPAALVMRAPLFRTPIAEREVLPRPAVAAAAVAGAAATQPVATPGVAVSFDYCLVTLERPWLPDGFLALRDWYLTGYARGDISGGTGAQDDAGAMPLLPRGLLAVRNLTLHADWQQPDLAAAPQALAFGPFSLHGSTFADGKLSCPGLQIVGWFCAAFPVLPPLGDPALASVAPAAPGSAALPATAPAAAVSDPAPAPAAAPSDPAATPTPASPDPAAGAAGGGADAASAPVGS